MKTVSMEQARQIAEILGYRVCTGHTDEIGEAALQLGLMTTINVMSQTHMYELAQHVPNAYEIMTSTDHNVSAEAGLIDCYDPQHRIQGACCGIIKEDTP